MNSTKEGGGVAEVLRQLIPLEQALGIDARWEVITGDRSFYECTKSFHNALQGTREVIPDPLLRTYEETNAENAERLRTTLAEADFVFVHDPQPAAMLQSVPERKGIWIWRCHIDVRRPYRPVWRYLRTWVSRYDASIFSLPEYAQPLPHPQYLIPPSIDPLNEKNCELPAEEVAAERERFGLDPELPLVVQVSRFDRFKDPVGVIAAYRLVKAMTPIQLVLAGGGASDDPEGEVVLEQVRRAAEGDPDIHVLMLPSDAHRTINALQRAADLIMQKSIREGFGLTVTEGMWKRKAGYRRRHRRHPSAGDRPLHRVPGAHTRRGRPPHPLSAAPTGSPGGDGGTRPSLRGRELPHHPARARASHPHARSAIRQPRPYRGGPMTGCSDRGGVAR